MIKEAFGKGISTEAAVEAAKAELNAPWDAEIHIEVIKTASKKILGLFGGSDAEVRVYYEIPDPIKAETPKAKAPKASPKKEVSKPVEKKSEAKVEKKSEETVKAEPKKQMFKGDASEKAEKYIRSVLGGMGVNKIDMTVSEDDEGVVVQLDCGNDYGYVIGRRGETLDAIQYLTRLVINKGNDKYKRVTINAGNYRERREETLKELAKRTAARVKKSGRNVCLDPMNPYERRIIHTTIQEIEGADSYSVGSESDRRVVVTLAEGFKATNPGYNRGRDNNYRRRESSHNTADTQPSREPRSDSAGSSLYGKIEPKNKAE